MIMIAVKCWLIVNMALFAWAFTDPIGMEWLLGMKEWIRDTLTNGEDS